MAQEYASRDLVQTKLVLVWSRGVLGALGVCGSGLGVRGMGVGGSRSLIDLFVRRRE